MYSAIFTTNVYGINFIEISQIYDRLTEQSIYEPFPNSRVTPKRLRNKEQVRNIMKTFRQKLAKNVVSLFLVPEICITICRTRQKSEAPFILFLKNLEKKRNGLPWLR